MSRKLFNFLFIAVISFTIAMQPLSVSASSNETDGFFSNASLLEYIEKFLNKNDTDVLSTDEVEEMTKDQVCENIHMHLNDLEGASVELRNIDGSFITEEIVVDGSIILPNDFDEETELDVFIDNGEEVLIERVKVEKDVCDVYVGFTHDDFNNEEEVNEVEKLLQAMKEEMKHTNITDKKHENAVDVDLVSAYDNLDFGISYEETVELIGAEGEYVTGSKSELNGEVVSESVLYTWENTEGHVLSIGFLNNQLISKSMIAGEIVKVDYATEEDFERMRETKDTGSDNDSKSGSGTDKEGTNDDDVDLDLDLVATYDKLAFGISYEEAVEIIGAEGEYVTGNTGELNGEVVTESYIYSWENNEGHVLSLSFLNDKLISKSLIAGEDVRVDYATEDDIDKIGLFDDTGIDNVPPPSGGNGTGTATGGGDPLDNTPKKNTLPNTATNSYNLIAIGIFIVVLGGFSLIIARYRQKKA